MLEYTVYWQINDGRKGYPNIIAEPSVGDYSNAGFRSVNSYENAIRSHGIRRGAYRASTSSHYIIEEIGR